MPHSARIWNYWLGGKDNYAVDREAGDQFSAIFPGIVDIARADRAFLGRAVRYLAGEAGVRQFLDVGTGLPTANNTHRVAQGVAPESRIVYVDNDPLVLAHARALLTSSPEGATHYVDADMADPEKILQEAAKSLDLTEPVALMLMGVLATSTTTTRRCRSWPAARRPPVRQLPGDQRRHRHDEALEEALRPYEASGAVPYHPQPGAVRRLLRWPGPGRARCGLGGGLAP